MNENEQLLYLGMHMCIQSSPYYSVDFSLEIQQLFMFFLFINAAVKMRTM